MYSEKTVDHFRNPRNAGEIADASGVGEEGNMKCGDVMKIFIKVDENEVITNVKFQTYGCIAAIASTDMLCEMVKGKTVSEVEKITPKNIADGLGKLPPIKFHCSIMGHEALSHAIKDYKSKKLKA